MAFSFVVLAPVALMQPWESHRRTLEKQWKGVVYVGSFMVGGWVGGWVLGWVRLVPCALAGETAASDA